MRKLCAILVMLFVLAAVANAGSVSGSLTMLNDVDTFVDLTAEGTTDWVNWGWVTEKTGGTAIDSTLTMTGTNTTLGVAWDSRINVSWTDGDPNPAGTDEKGFNHTGPNIGDGLSFTVQASAASQRLRVYLVGWNSDSLLTATLSGGGTYSVAVTEEQVSNHHYAVCDIMFAGAGETLTVTSTLTAGGGGTDWDNAGFQAATLADAYGIMNIAPTSNEPDVDPAGQILEWAGSTDPNISSVIGYTIYIDPNETWVENGESTLVDYFDDTIPGTQTTYNPDPDLSHGTPYFWRVVETVQYDYMTPGDTNDITSDVWAFTTKLQDTPPVVDAGPKFTTTTVLAATPFALKGTVTDDGTTALTVGWEAFDVALGGGATTKVTFDDTTDPNTTVTVSEAGTYVVKLTADDLGNDPVSDQKEIVVLDDACQAIKSTGTWAANYYDRNDDCIVDLTDFAIFALEWLNSTALAENYESFVGIGDPDTTEALVVEYWLNVAGTDVNDLLADARYPDAADGAFFITGELRAPANAGSNFGGRIRGYIVPPTTGAYTFYIASDDASRLFLSADTTPVDTDPALGNQIAEVTAYTAVDEWDNVDEPGQISATVSLTAGNYYYIEVLQKEDAGDDHLSVAWVEPGTVDIVVIPGTALRYDAP